MPFSLSTHFTHDRRYEALGNTYANGEYQRSLLTFNSRKKWTLNKRLPPGLLTALRNFYDAHNGGLEPFYFYDPFETFPKYSHDDTGFATQGRYIVVFRGKWSQNSGIARADVDIVLEEVA
jgi:hypothetical protein